MAWEAGLHNVPSAVTPFKAALVPPCPSSLQRQPRSAKHEQVTDLSFSWRAEEILPWGPCWREPEEEGEWLQLDSGAEGVEELHLLISKQRLRLPCTRHCQPTSPVAKPFAASMDIVERVLSVAQAIHAQFEQVKCCKHQCQRLVERIQILLEPVRILRAQPRQHISHHEEELMKKLLRALEEAQKLVMKYSQTSWIQKFLRARSTGEEFVWVNESLEDIAQGLSLLLQAEQKQAFLEAFQSKTCRRQDAEDLRDDRAFLDQVIASTEEPKDVLEEIYIDRECMESKMDWMKSELNKVIREMERLKKVNVGKREDITEIKRDQLTFHRHLQDTECYDLYEGEYLKYPVAIKTFKRPLTTDPVKVRDIFEKEIQTLKKFESPNILRMYGICIEENDGSPCFSIVMEYCKHGTLRDVLNKQQHLPWDIRIRMALGAARGLYRLHQTGERSRLHGCICSSKFLVAGDYCVKLSGFELCETESSIKRKAKKDWKQVSMLAYIAPENLKDINYPYKRPCEIYSFGIVLAEIATSKIPFEGCTPEEIVEKICNHHYWDPLGEDCPEDLRKIIEQCRAFDPSQRPSAEEIVDSLADLEKSRNQGS